MTTCVTSPSEIERLRDQRTALRLQLQIRGLQSAARQEPLIEDFGEVVDRREYLFDTPDFGRPVQTPLAALSDRQAGKLFPVYQCEQDLARIRGRAHNVATLTPMHAGVVDALANYVIGPGFTFTAHADDAVQHAVGLAAAVQRVIDRFLDDNDFYGSLDREAHARSREDGEAFLLLTPRPAGRIDARFVECEQITQPADPRPLEDWLGCGDEFPSCWSFGIHTPAGETNRPLGYHVVSDATGLDWDYVPVGRMEHLKRNVPANAKRGVSDFYPVLGDLEREAKLRRNTAHSAALQAAIAWILEPPPGTLPAQAHPTGTTDNAAELDAEIEAQLDAAAGAYETRVTDYVEYAGIVPINPDGAITQVHWSAGPHGALTRAGRNNEFSLAIPPYAVRRRGGA